MTLHQNRLGQIKAAMKKFKSFFERWWFVLVLLALLPLYVLIAINNERIVDYVNNGFFTFWLAGHLPWIGGHPYSPIDWVNGHQVNGATWIPNKIFPYPLPLALITAPLGLLPLNQAYIAWDVLAQVLIAVCILWLATRWDDANRQLYAIFVLAATILNGNIYLGLMTGTISALFLVFLTLGLYFIEKRHPILAGVALAGLALKPPLLTVVALIGLWLLLRHNWKTLGGILIGGLGLLAIGLIQDVHWVEKFRGASENLLNMRLGNQPTIISYTRLACAGNLSCAFTWYGLIALALIAIFTWLIWKRQETLSPMMAFSAAISLGVLLPPYLWSYDYVVLVIPICYISFDLIRRRKTYLYSTIFLLILDVLSIIGLALFWMNPDSEALTIQRDMWSIWVGLLVLATTWWMVFQAPDTRPAHIESTEG